MSLGSVESSGPDGVIVGPRVIVGSTGRVGRGGKVGDPFGVGDGQGVRYVGFMEGVIEPDCITKWGAADTEGSSKAALVSKTIRSNIPLPTNVAIRIWRNNRIVRFSISLLMFKRTNVTGGGCNGGYTTQIGWPALVVEINETCTGKAVPMIDS